MADLGSLIVRLGVDTSGVMTAKVELMDLANVAEKTAKKVTNALIPISSVTINKINAVAQRIRTFGYLSAAIMTAPLIAFSKKSFEAARDFEFTMAKIEGLTDVPKEVINEWSKSIKQMSVLTGQGPQELAEALYFVSSSGFQTKEALDITNISAQAAAAGMSNAATIADMLTSAMNAYKTSGLTAARTMDIFTAAVREGKIEPDQFARVLGSIMPIAAEAGIGLDQVAGAMAAMSLGGASAANSATYLRNIIQKLIQPSSTVEKLLRDMGTSSEDLRRSLSEQGLMATLIRLRDLTEEHGATMFELLPNIRALLAALNLTGENIETNMQIMKAATDSAGSFSKAVDIASQTMQFRWNQALATSKVALIELGDVIGKAVLPYFESLVQRLQKLTKWFTELSDSSQRLVVTLGAIAIAIGPLSLLVSVMVYSFTGLIQIINGVAKALAAVKVAAAAAGISLGWVVAAAAAVYGIVKLTKALREHSAATNEWVNFQNKVNAQISQEIFSLNDVFRSLKNANEGSEERAELIKIVNSRYGDYLGNLLTEKSTLEDIAKAQDEATEAMVRNIASRESQIKLGEVMSGIQDKFTKELESFTTVYGKVYGSDRIARFITDLMTTADKVIKERGHDLRKGALRTSEDVYRIWNTYIKKISQAQGYIKYSFDDFLSHYSKFLQYKAGKIPIIESLKGIIAVYSNVKGIQEEVVESAKNLSETTQNVLLRDIMKGMEKEERKLNNLKAALKTMKEPIDDVNKDLLRLYETTTKDLGKTGLAEAIPLMEAVRAKMAEVSGGAEELIGNVKSFMEITAKYTGKMDYLEYMAEHARSLGVEFDYVKEYAKALNDVLEDLIKGKFAETPLAKQIAEDLKNLPPNIYEVEQAMKKLNEEFKIIEGKAGISIELTDVDSEKLRALDKYLEALLKVKAEAKNLEDAFLPIGTGLGIGGFITTIKTVDVLNALIQDTAEEIDKYKDKISSDEMIRLEKFLQLQADAFGGVDIQIEVLNNKLLRQERILRNLYDKGKENTQEWWNTVDSIIAYRTEMMKLKNQQDIKYLQDTVDSFRDLESVTGFINGEIRMLQDAFEQLSRSGKGSPDLLRDIAKEIKHLERVQKLADGLQDVFTDLFSSITDGAESMVESLVRSFEKMIAQILAKMLVFAILKLIFKKDMQGTGLTDFLLGQAVQQQQQMTMQQPIYSMAKGGIVPSGFPNDTFPAWLSSGEIVLPKVEYEKFQPLNTLAKTGEVKFKEFFDSPIEKYNSIKIPKLRTGGIIPEGFPNDSFLAKLSSREVVVPSKKYKDFLNIPRSVNRSLKKLRQQEKDTMGNLSKSSLDKALKRMKLQEKSTLEGISKSLLSKKQLNKLTKSLVARETSMLRSMPTGYEKSNIPSRLVIDVPKPEVPQLERAGTNVHITLDGKISRKDLALVIRRMDEMN